MSVSHALNPFVEKLDKRGALTPDDRQALLNLPHRVRNVDRRRFIFREGLAEDHTSILVTGFAFSSSVGSGGGRAVLALHLDGDPLSIGGCSGEASTYDVQALTDVTVADISRAKLCELAHAHPRIGSALWHLTARNASMLGEWLINVGRRNARTRISHLLCEIATRQGASGIDAGSEYLMPLTPEQLGDSTGLTSVHVNRTLKGLRHDKLIATRKDRIAILNWQGLKNAGDFEPGYLQLV